MLKKNLMWLVAGTVAVLAIRPGTASAVGSQLVTLVNGTSSGQASVDAAHRLQTAEANPASVVTLSASVGSCAVIYTVPTGKSLIIKTVSFTDPGYAANGVTRLYSNSVCRGKSVAEGYLYLGSYGGVTNTQVDLGPGAVLSTGRTLSAASTNGATDVMVYAYLVPGNFPTSG